MQPNVAILGAGPVGLDAALACAEAGLPCTVYEAGPAVAHHIRDWGHVRLFTPWELNVSPRMRAALPGLAVGDGTDTATSTPTSAQTPTGAEFVDALLDPVSRLPAVAANLRLRTRVLAVSRAGLLKHEEIGTGARAATPFRLLLDGESGEYTAEASLVLDCTGSYAHPNSLGDGGIPAPGERALGARIARTLPRAGDAERWAGTVLLVGAGKSAQTAARDLAALPGTRVEWIVRDPEPTWGAVPDDSLPGRQALVDTARALASGTHDRVSVRTGSRVAALHPDGDALRVTLHTPAGARTVRADHVLALTGYAADASLYRQLQIHECYATGAPMNLSATLLSAAGGADCLAQPPAGLESLRSPEPDFFVLGAKSYGRLSTFLLRTGYEQVGEVVAAYAPEAVGTPGAGGARGA